MPNFRLPWSGDVTQTINPWNWFFKTVGNQFGFINIGLGKSSDPELEAQILNDVGSYGRQIGQIGDALRVLIEHSNLQNLNLEDQRAISALAALTAIAKHELLVPVAVVGKLPSARTVPSRVNHGGGPDKIAKTIDSIEVDGEYR